MGWFITNGLLNYTEEGDPPKGSIPVKPPEGFAEHPERFMVAGELLVELGSPEAKAHLEQRPEALKLTQEEIAVVQAAIAEARL